MSWGADAQPARGRSTWARVRQQVSPLGSRLSPLRYFSDWRVEQYYRRTLRDRAVADTWARHYLSGLDLDARAPVLDHGCGRGRNTALLAQLGFEVAAQDVVAHPWWQAVRECQFQQVPASAPRLPWTNESFGLVLDVQVIHDLEDRRLADLVDEVGRVLVPGGYWVLLEANAAGYGAWMPRRYWGRLHTLDRVRELTAQAGFRECDCRYEGVYAPVLPSAINFLRKQAWPGTFSVDDFGSPLETMIPDDRRAFWVLRLRKDGRGE